MASILALIIAFGLPKIPGIGGSNADLPPPETGTLSLGDSDSLIRQAADLAGMKEDPILKEQIKFKIFSGRDNYNQFFKKSAQLHGDTVAAQAFAALTTEHMKEVARSATAKGAVSTSIKETVGDKPEKDWTVDDTAAILALEKKRGELNSDQLTSLAQSAATVALLSKYLVNVGQNGASLRKSGDSLRSNFDKEGPLTKGYLGLATTDSVQSIDKATKQAPETAKEVAHLVTALQAFARS